MPYDLSLNSKPSCQTLSNALEMSRKTPRVSSEGQESKFVNISCVIARSWETQESCLRKPD